MKYIVQYLLALVVIVFSTVFTWYEGSEIRNNTWERKYSAFFSKLFTNELTTGADISQLDHFIYAAKFKPLFPTLLIVSLSYVLMLSGYLLSKQNKRNLIIIQCSFGILYLLLGLTISDSPTLGGKYLTTVFIILCIANFIVAIMVFLKLKKDRKIIYSSI
ncbi:MULTISPECIES: DUF4306 domain-containing protein [Paraliobacillus]|uniref:DUF4306 domain-containing protein n=1 Tax=Paraliobacillus TaxID=200903 RepID=UPI000DD32D16|nr:MULTISPECIES: DUF4306 domain-containing protein [Paraliobacillus]